MVDKGSLRCDTGRCVGSTANHTGGSGERLGTGRCAGPTRAIGTARDGMGCYGRLGIITVRHGAVCGLDKGSLRCGTGRCAGSTRKHTDGLGRCAGRTGRAVSARHGAVCGLD